MFEANFGKEEYLSVRWVYRNKERGILSEEPSITSTKRPKIL